MRLGGTHRHHQRAGPRQPLPFTAADLIRLELNLLGHPRRADERHADGAEASGRGPHQDARSRARFPLAKVGEAHTLLETSPDLVGRIVVLPWA